MTLEDLEALARKKLGPYDLPGFAVTVQMANSTDFEVRVASKAFDYYAALVARPSDSVEYKAVELDAMREQIIENILLGHAKHRDGYPKELGT